jgi:soluble lytic murein transglycosylase
MIVPTYGNANVAPSGLPTPRLVTTEMPDIAGRQMQSQGAEMLKIGQDMLDRANIVRTDKALNDLTEEKLRLTFDPQAGYLNLKGNAALTRPDGKPLEDEYGEALQRRADALRASLGNEAQRSMFDRAAGGMLTTFRGRIMEHRNQEFIRDAVSVQKGVIDTAQREVALNYRDPAAINSALGRIESHVEELRKITGQSASEFDPMVREAASSALRGAMEAALDNGDLDGARALMSQYRERMGANDILRMDEEFSKQTDAADAIRETGALMNAYASRIAPNDRSRLSWAQWQQESGGKQINKNGSTTLGPPTRFGRAVGIAQILPSTGPEAAKLAGLPWDEKRFYTDANYNAALGNAYMDDELRRFGALPEALAAYNWGRDNVKAAIKEHGGDWLAHAPKETQKYVNDVTSRYLSGAQPPAPSRLELDQRLSQAFAERPRALKMAREELDRRLKLIDEEKKENSTRALGGAYQALIDNGGDFAGLSAGIRNSIPSDKYDDVLTFAGKLAKGETVKTDMPLYIHLREIAANEPKMFAAINMAQFLNSIAPSQMEQLLDLQGKASADNKEQLFASAQQKIGYLADRLELKGKNRAQFYDVATQELSSERKAKGRDLTDDERDRILNRLILSGDHPEWYTTNRYYEVLDEGLPANKFTPEWTDADIRRATSSLQKTGISEPTNSQINNTLLKFYRGM